MLLYETCLGGAIFAIWFLQTYFFGAIYNLIFWKSGNAICLILFCNSDLFGKMDPLHGRNSHSLTCSTAPPGRKTEGSVQGCTGLSQSLPGAPPADDRRCLLCGDGSGESALLIREVRLERPARAGESGPTLTTIQRCPSGCEAKQATWWQCHPAEGVPATTGTDDWGAWPCGIMSRSVVVGKNPLANLGAISKSVRTWWSIGTVRQVTRRVTKHGFRKSANHEVHLPGGRASVVGLHGGGRLRLVGPVRSVWHLSFLWQHCFMAACLPLHSPERMAARSGRLVQMSLACFPRLVSFTSQAERRDSQGRLASQSGRTDP